MKIAVVTDMATPNLKSKGFGHIVGVPPFADETINHPTAKLSPPIPLLGPVMLGTCLRRAGFSDVSILDFYVMPEQAEAAAEENKYDFIAFHTTFSSPDRVHRIGQLLRRSNPDATIVVGGPTALNYDTNRDHPFDLFVFGEGDEIIVEMANILANGGCIDEITGTFKTIGNCREREPISNLDSLPFPDWDLVDLPLYLPLLPIQTARGCPFNCRYCKEQHFWKKPVRRRSVDGVIAELRRDVEEFGVKTFRFVDSTLTNPPRRTKELCRAIIDADLDIRWSSYARAEAMSEELADLMVEAGCFALNFGMESGAQAILDTMNKALKVEQIRLAISAARNAGLLVHANFLIGFPGENSETIRETVQLIRDARPTTFCFNPLMVIPGTELYDNREDFGLSGMLGQWEHETMNSTEASQLVHDLFSEEFIDPTDSFYCFGGEHIAMIHTCLGRSREDVLQLYGALNDLCANKEVAKEESRQIVLGFLDDTAVVGN